MLYSLNYSPELTGIGKYNGEMCTELVKRGLDVKAIVAPPYYPEWQVHKAYSQYFYQSEFNQGVQLIRCPLYVPKKVTTVKRLVHLVSFAFSSLFALVSKLFSKSDIIMLVQPTLFCAPFALLYAKLTSTKCVMHIQDYEVDAMLGLGLFGKSSNNQKSNAVVKLIKNVECWLTKRFDAVSTISLSMIENAKAKGVDQKKIIYFPNWSDTEFVTPSTCGKALRAEWGFSSRDKIILYAGNIGKKQGLELVLETAQNCSDNSDVKFVLVGAGAHVEHLKDLAKQMKLENVFFKPLQHWDRVPEMLALADVHLVVQNKGAADAVLPSKLTNILSAGGHALVTAEKSTELGNIANNHPGIFTLVEPEDVQAFTLALQTIVAKDTTQHNILARKFATQYLAKDKILDQFVTDLEKLTGKRV
jgi:colanic acid biosynthesis glycosyl transferase WcaI